MSGFLLLLVKVNLAMGAAIVLVSLIRRPLRAQFGAAIAYAIWLLVPIAGVASLLPPREIPAPAHVASVHAPAAPAPVAGFVPPSILNAIEQPIRQSVLMPTAPMKPLGSSYELFDTSRLLFAAWVLGLLFMAAYLTRVQIRFSAAVRRGQAGPAVLGFFRPRIVTPVGFQEQFTPQEQSAILAHERVHLARQDARINALAAFLRCLCWFNPLIHLGARFLRIDQELACDAIAVSASVSRQTYAKALLKSQVMVGVLPFGCNWPGPQHPLVERIALLQRKPPGTARRLVGAGLVLLTATSAGLGAWAAQPPVPAPSNIGVHAKESINSTPAAIQTATAGPTRQVTGAAAPLRPRTDAVSVAAPDRQVRANGESQPLTPPSADLSGLPAPDSLPTPTLLASAISPVPESNVQPASPPVAASSDPSAGSAQAALREQPLPSFDPNEPYEIRKCGMGNGMIKGRVTSSTTIQMPGFVCVGSGAFDNFNVDMGRSIFFDPGACTHRKTLWGAMENVPLPTSSCLNRPWLTMTVQFANPADARKMPLGKLVTLKGDSRVITQNKVSYLLVQNARILYVDPFGR